MLRKQDENHQKLLIQRYVLPLPTVQTCWTSGLLQPLQLLVNPALLVQYKGTRPTKEPVSLTPVLCTSRATHGCRNLLPLLWVHLLESCPPFCVTYLVIIPLLRIQILLCYLCEVLSSTSHFSRGFILSLKTKVWLLQCVSEILHSQLCQWLALILDKTVYPLCGSRSNIIFL